MSAPSGPSGGFTEGQKQYLQGFASGLELARARRELPVLPATPGASAALPGLGPFAGPAAGSEASAESPEDIHLRAQDRFLTEGKKLSAEEAAKREKNPLDLWDELRRRAQEGRFPEGMDVFRFKFHGLFYVAPAQDSFMCRLRIPNGLLSSHQMRGIADIATRFGGGHADVTSRANLQLREIRPENSVDVLTSLQELGLLTRGAGADNIRNITGTPTAGIDPQELIDTRPLAKELHHYILNHRELYGLPRKFNIAFDGGGMISSLEDTNDMGFAAVRVAAGSGVLPGVYFRVELGGITGHGDFARDSGLLLEPRQCVPVAAAMVRVFIENGDRTDRKRARLKYLIDRWGLERFLEETQRRLAFPLRRLPLERCELRGPVLKHGHVGFHPQKQEGLAYVGVVLPAGRMTAGQVRGLAAIADRHGSGTIRFTVWQNLLISDIREEAIPAVERELAALGLTWQATSVRGGLVACTGNSGCRYSATDTKGHALEITRHLDARIDLDQPINIHLTGCPHSCAQHCIGDIGLLGTRVAAGEEAIEGYHVFVGGGYGPERGLGRELFRDVPFPEVPPLLERMLHAYLEHRAGKETFREFAGRHSIEALLALFGRRRVVTV